MNSYHLSYLYDSLGAVVEDYSYSDLDKRISMFPELMGADIDYNDFLDQYFFNTAFLIDPERFNNMDAKEKQQHGFTDPCLFGVINHLTPTKDEILLKQLEKDPFAKTEWSSFSLAIIWRKLLFLQLPLYTGYDFRIKRIAVTGKMAFHSPLPADYKFVEIPLNFSCLRKPPYLHPEHHTGEALK